MSESIGDRDSLSCVDNRGREGSFTSLFRLLYRGKSKWIECSNGSHYSIPDELLPPVRRISPQFAVYIPEINGFQMRVGGVEYCNVLRRFFPSTICVPVIARRIYDRVMKRLHLMDHVTPSTLLYYEMARTGLYDKSYSEYFLEESVESPVSWSSLSPAMTPILHLLYRSIIVGDHSLYEAYRMFDQIIRYPPISLVLASIPVYEPVHRFMFMESMYPPRWLTPYGLVCSIHSAGRLDIYEPLGIRDVYKTLHTYGIVWCDKRWVNGRLKW